MWGKDDREEVENGLSTMVVCVLPSEAITANAAHTSLCTEPAVVCRVSKGSAKASTQPDSKITCKGGGGGDQTHNNTKYNRTPSAMKALTKQVFQLSNMSSYAICYHMQHIITFNMSSHATFNVQKNMHPLTVKTEPSCWEMKTHN